MPIARMSVCVSEDAALRRHRFVSAAGEPVAWLNVGVAGELCVYGSPVAMRRLGEAAVGSLGRDLRAALPAHLVRRDRWYVARVNGPVTGER